MAAAPSSTLDVPTAQEWKDLLEELLPPQGAWSEEQYLVLNDHGTRLVEFTDGCLEALPMPTDKHQSVLAFLFLAFVHFLNPAAERSSLRRCAFGRESSASPISCSCCRRPTRAGKTARSA